ncbi:MAG: response regulator transcription factor, partial [Lachnospiraceae bacterium]|nr:response regulator transcription factor [Lachnospiraceae bacterium]
MARILIVEDDKAIAEGIAINMEFSGYEYKTFDNGMDVANYLPSDHKFDLALLDIMLPGIDGFELMEHMQQYDIPVIYLTAKVDVSSRIKGLRDGAEDYILKPFEMLELLVRIEKILIRTGKFIKTLVFADFSLDLDKRIVLHNREEIVLPPLEFDLLVILVKYKNRTLPRERLLNEIWGIDYFGGTRTVDVH